MAALRESADAASRWLFDDAIPLWLDHGVDWQRGGLYDSLDPVTLRNCADFKRLRVTTRQIYVFSEAALRGAPRAEAAVDIGLSFLLERIRHPAGGFASRCDLAGDMVDDTRDLYDLAFTLFAFAHAYRLKADTALRAEALALLTFLQAELRDPAGGYAEALPHRLPRRQNPHMHLLEAALACAEHMPHPAFDALCDELGDLAGRHFIDAESGLLFEYYSQHLVPERPGGRALVEPGHHFEWAWLLAELARVRGRHVPGGKALARFAMRHGFDPVTGLLRGELFEDGATATASVRLWPHCEWLKATLVPGGEAGDPVRAWQALARFLDVPTKGLWFERWDAEAGIFAVSPVPASSLYHITAAICAFDRYAA